MDSIIIEFDKNRLIYDQIYRAFRDGILSGSISGGERLPSKRSLAGQLGVSVNSVDTAYQLLSAEGYIVSRQRSGFFACDVAPQPKISVQKKLAPKEQGDEKTLFNFATSGIDSELFPYKLWCRIEREVLGDSELFNRSDNLGDQNLRAVICEYLRGYRGVECHPEELVIGAGIEYLLCTLARLFEGKTVAIEDPGYGRTAKVFGDFGVKTIHIPLDNEGMSVRGLQDSAADLAYITPSCQFPTGVTMPVKRRHDIMKWAQSQPERFVIEDDYNSEFRFSTRPIPSLKSQDTASRVVHIGTFSKSVAPSLRIAYMLLPEGLLVRWRERFGGYACTVSRFEQQALYRFISKGHFSRHINRLRIACKKRHDHLVRELQLYFKDDVELAVSNSGLHILAKFNLEKSTQSLIDIAAEHGVKVHAINDFVQLKDAPNDKRLIFGYSAMDERQITEAVKLLRTIWR